MRPRLSREAREDGVAATAWNNKCELRKLSVAFKSAWRRRSLGAACAGPRRPPRDEARVFSLLLGLSTGRMRCPGLVVGLNWDRSGASAVQR